MKKLSLALLLTLSLLLTACGTQIPLVPPTDTTLTDTTVPDSVTEDIPSSAPADTTTPSTTCPDGESADDPHVDTNHDGYCDICGQLVLVYLDVYSINDLHGKFQDTAAQPGVDELTTYLETARKTHNHTLILSAGDMWQGSSESNLTQGKLVTEWMNRLGVTAMTLGNHEYDWSESVLKSNAELAEFPFLAINIYDRTTHQRVDYCTPSVVVDAGPVKIGIIGAMGDCYSSIAADKTENVYFKVGHELTQLVKEESARLRAEGVDCIIYMIHDGYTRSSSGTKYVNSQNLSRYYDTTLSDGFVDIVFEGHTHQSYILKDEYGVYHLQGGGENRGITHAAISINVADHSTTVTEAAYIPNTTYAQSASSPLVNELLEKYREEIAPGFRVVGQNSTHRTGNELRQLVADRYYETGLARWGEAYDIVLGGGFISVRSPKNLPAGDVTYAQLQMLFPFDNQLVLCSIQGSYLASKFFETGNRNYFISYGAYGESVRQNIDPNQTYYIVTDTYSSSYAPNHLTEIERYDENVYARDLLSDFIASGGLDTPKAAPTLYLPDLWFDPRKTA